MNSDKPFAVRLDTTSTKLACPGLDIPELETTDIALALIIASEGQFPLNFPIPTIVPTIAGGVTTHGIPGSTNTSRTKSEHAVPITSLMAVANFWPICGFCVIGTADIAKPFSVIGLGDGKIFSWKK